MQIRTYSAKLEEVDANSELTSLEAGNWIYVQRDAKDDEIVALHKISLEVSVKVGDAAAKYGYGEYYGDAFKDIVLDCAANQTVTAKMGSTDLTVSAIKDGKVTVSYSGKVADDIEIAVATDTSAQDNQARANERAAAINGETVTYSAEDAVTSSNLEEKLTASLRQILADKGDDRAQYAAFEYSIPDYDYSGSGRTNLPVVVTVKVYDATATANITVVINH